MKRLDLIGGVTCAGKTDGGGAQVQAVMSAILFADAIGVPYFHTPFHSVAHSDDPKAFAARWESAFNLGKGYDRPPDDVPIVTGKTLVEGYSGPPAILRQEYFHGFADRNPDRYSPLISRFRSRLALPDVPNSERIIAVHIRRGDILENPEYASRYTPNAVVAKTIAAARIRHPIAAVVVFSEGEEADFAGLPPNCEFELNADIFHTIARMISADCLIMSKSSLSYVSGLLSKGTVYYERFWHSPLSSWNIVR